MISGKKKSLERLLKTAVEPVGATMYVWGGGWNETDDGAGIEAVSIGVSRNWAAFASMCDSDYDYEKTRFRIHDGLDCSGYMGWLIYNLFNDVPGNVGYVMKARNIAAAFAANGWGRCTPAEDVKNRQPGDILSMSGHVWLCLGICSDGSALLIHSSPPGVSICGTLLPGSVDSEAVDLAQKVMSNYYPHWYARFPRCFVGAEYLTQSTLFRWNRDTLSDSLGLSGMSAEEIVRFIFTT